MIIDKKMLSMVSLSLLIVMLALVIFKPYLPLGSSETADSVLPTKYAEATDGINAELANCLLEAGENFMEHSSDASPIRMPGGSNVVLRANLATAYAEVVCETY